MSKTEALSRAIASIAVCVAGVLISQMQQGSECIGGLVIIVGLMVVWGMGLTNSVTVFNSEEKRQRS